MKSNQIFNVVLLTGVFAVTGCMSIDIPRREALDDCLIVVPTEASAPVGIDFAREYEFVFAPEYPPVKVPGISKGFAAFVVKEPGVKIVSIRSAIGKLHEGRYRGNSGELKANMSLPYKPGKLFITEFAFVQECVFIGSDLSSSIRFRKTTAEEKAAWAAKLSKDEDYASWEK